MTRVKALPKGHRKEPYGIFLSTLAIALILLCLVASHWQYQRGVDRHANNVLIASHVSQTPVMIASVIKNLTVAQWRQTTVQGAFDSSNQILLRNRYFEGKYGFDLLTLFHEKSGLTFWIDRGWIPPGVNASTPPTMPPTISATVTITGRVRLDYSLPQGSFFAIPSGKNMKLIPQWNAQSKVTYDTENFYLDLLTVSDTSMAPEVPVELPELTDGPHMAYALQWIFFAGLIFYARILLRRSR